MTFEKIKNNPIVENKKGRKKENSIVKKSTEKSTKSTENKEPTKDELYKEHMRKEINAFLANKKYAQPNASKEEEKEAKQKLDALFVPKENPEN